MEMLFWMQFDEIVESQRQIDKFFMVDGGSHLQMVIRLQLDFHQLKFSRQLVDGCADAA
jgi:hypothetical protein